MSRSLSAVCVEKLAPGAPIEACFKTCSLSRDLTKCLHFRLRGGGRREGRGMEGEEREEGEGNGKRKWGRREGGDGG